MQFPDWFQCHQFCLVLLKRNYLSYVTRIWKMDRPGGDEKGMHVAKIRKLQTQLFQRLPRY